MKNFRGPHADWSATVKGHKKAIGAQKPRQPIEFLNRRFGCDQQHVDQATALVCKPLMRFERFSRAKEALF